MGQHASVGAFVLALAAVGCNSTPTKKPPERRPDQSNAPAEPEEQPGAPSSGSSDEEGPEVRTIDWREFLFLPWFAHREDAPTPMPPRLENPSTAKPQLGTAALSLTKVVGATDFFCGLAKAGGIYCWGRQPDFFWGKFEDLAVTDDEVCAVTTSGVVRCYRVTDDVWGVREKASPPVQNARRVSGAGSNFCALSNSDEVTCWTRPEGSPFVPPAGVRAKFFDVGEKFACLADQERKLLCFGDTGALNLPETPLTIQDLAVGEDFVCVVDSGEEARCFGKTFDFEGKKAKAVSARFGTACARSANGQATCRGRLSATFSGVSRIGIGSNDVCIVNEQGRLACQGKAGSWSAISPPEVLPTRKGSGSKEDLREFLRLFRKAHLPLTFGKGGDNPMGEPLPKRFGKLVGQAAANYWTGVRFELPGGYHAVTLLDPSVPRIELHVFSESGKHVDQRVLAHLETRRAPTRHRWDNGYVDLFAGRSTRAEVKEDGTIVNESLELIEVGYKALCGIVAFEAVAKWNANGKFTPQRSQVTQTRNGIVKNGCVHDSPLAELELKDDTVRKILKKWKALRIAEVAQRGDSVEIEIAEAWLESGSYNGFIIERIRSASSCEHWELVLSGREQHGWSPEIEKSLGPGCCPSGPCPHENQPAALHLALVDAVEREDVTAISKWIHPEKGCEVTILENPYSAEAKLTPGDSRIVKGQFRIGPHISRDYFGCDQEFKDNSASCRWGVAGARWEAHWEKIDGKPYLIRYQFSGC